METSSSENALGLEAVALPTQPARYKAGGIGPIILKPTNRTLSATASAFYLQNGGIGLTIMPKKRTNVLSSKVGGGVRAWLLQIT